MRNYLVYLESLKKRKGDTPSEGMLDLLVIETNLTIFSTTSWIVDSSLSAHLCTSIQDLIESRGLRCGEMILQISNGVRVTVVAIGIYPL